MNPLLDSQSGTPFISGSPEPSTGPGIPGVADSSHTELSWVPCGGMLTEDRRAQPAEVC